MARGLTTVLLFASVGLVSIVTGGQLVSAWERPYLSGALIVLFPQCVMASLA